MGHHSRLNRKGEDVQGKEEARALLMDCGKKTKRRLLSLLFLFSLISFAIVFSPCLPFSPFDFQSQGPVVSGGANPNPCSTGEASNCIYCDRTGYRSDICYLRGDIRTHSSSSSVFLFSPNKTAGVLIEKIRPYTRKWETSVMDTIDELRLKSVEGEAAEVPSCQKKHVVPAVFFSTGGYTGNVYHEFNDGIIPLYITSKKFNRQVVFVILEYHDWWMTKYGDIISRLSDYPPVDFSGDPATHCFSEAIVGLQIHDELSVNTSLTPNLTIHDFRELLDASYRPRIESLIGKDNEGKNAAGADGGAAGGRPRLVVLSRNGSRAITNEAEVVKTAEGVGFEVEVLRPDRTTELAKIYRVLNRTDVMVGVHGAAMTHFLFMRPGSVFIQVVPLGTDWAAEAYYGEPAKKMGLNYLGYKIWPSESSLSSEYKADDPVLLDPESQNKKGWEVTKRVYLEGQKLRLDLRRFKKRLIRVHWHCIAKRNNPGL